MIAFHEPYHLQQLPLSYRQLNSGQPLSEKIRLGILILPVFLTVTTSMTVVFLRLYFLMLDFQHHEVTA